MALGDLFTNKEDEIENNNSIVVYFNELPDYVPGIDYEPGYRVIANGGRIYECLLTHGPSYPYNLGPYEPQYPSTTLLDYYWVEIWQSDDLFYQGIETGGSYNRHIVQFPYYSSDDKYNWFICNHDNYSSVNNDPQNNNEDWKSVNYQTDINYNPGDIVLGQGAYSPFTFKCIMENGPNSSNGIQEPSETDFINEYWICLWSPGRCYGDKKFIIVEFDGAFYFNITSDETLFGFANNPTVRIHWIPISFWSDIRNYLRGDVVERYKIKYISVYNGSNIGNPPETDDGTNWSRLYLWPNTSDQNVYHQGEIVISENSQDNRLYICTVAGDGHDPYTNPGEEPGSSGCTFWEVWYP